MKKIKIKVKKDPDELPGFAKILEKTLAINFKKEIKKNKSGSISK